MRTPYTPVERAKKTSSARATAPGGAGGFSTAFPKRPGGAPAPVVYGRPLRIEVQVRVPAQDDATVARPRNRGAKNRLKGVGSQVRDIPASRGVGARRTWCALSYAADCAVARPAAVILTFPKFDIVPLTQINVANTRFGQKSIMRGIIQADLDELAEVREKAARVCEETKSLIEEHR